MGDLTSRRHLEVVGDVGNVAFDGTGSGHAAYVDMQAHSPSPEVADVDVNADIDTR